MKFRVTSVTNITSTRRWRVLISRLFCAWLFAVFLFGQSMAAHHGHDHSHEAPLGETCEVCILAGKTDESFDFKIHPNSDDNDIQTYRWVKLKHLALPAPISAPKLWHGSKFIDPPPEHHQRPDAARAPPLYM